MVLSSATLLAEHIKDAFKRQSDLYEFLCHSDCSIFMKQIKLKEFLRENNLMSAKRFALDLRNNRQNVYLAQENAGDLVLKRDALNHFQTAREELWTIRRNIRCFFGNASSHPNLIELLNRIETKFKFKAVCETFEKQFSQ